MVASLTETPRDLDIALATSRAAPNTIFWNRSSEIAPEREGNQVPAWLKEMEGLQVDVLVPARGPLHIAVCRNERADPIR